jgi:adenylate kinase family enzyme
MPGLARVVVVGATGSGKSTFAQRLAVRLGAEYVELDELFWDAHWTEAAPDVFRARVERATAGPRWVVAGTAGSAISCGPGRTPSSGSTTHSRSSCAA